MSQKISIVFMCVLLLIMTFSVSYAEPTTAIRIDGRSALLLDADTGTIVYALNEHEKMPVASITKIMTLYLAFEAIEQGKMKLDDEIIASRNAASMGGSQIYIEQNGRYSVSDILKSIIVSSANDACVALAEHIAGSEEAFVELMNNTAVELGLADTYFVNCTGLPASGHYMSAMDIATLSRHLIEHELFFNYSRIWSEHFKHPDGRVTLMSNTNKLIKQYNGCDGIKTGFTNEAMYCLSATAKRGDTRLIAVALGEPTSKHRNNDIAEMFNYGFANYKSYRLYDKGDTIKENIKIYGASESNINAISPQKSSVFIKKGGEKEIESRVVIYDDLCAPIERGQEIGYIEIVKSGELYDKLPITCNREVKRASFWQCAGMVLRSYCMGQQPAEVVED